VNELAMLNDLARQTVDHATWGRAGAFRKPLYDTYGFSRVPATIEYLFTGADSARAAALPLDVFANCPQRYETVVFFLVDGFGWHLFERFASLPFLRRFLDQGVVSKLTSQFPSTTAAHMTTLHTGLPVGQSGVYEWYYYEPAIDAVYAPLLFSLVGEKQRETLAGRGVRAADLYPAGTFYQRLAEHGVSCTILQHQEYARSTYSNHAFNGAQVRPYSTGEGDRDSIAGALGALAEELLSGGGRCYYFVYIASIDALGHKYGLASPQFQAQVETTFSELEGLYQRLAGKLPSSLLLLSADHGMTPVDGATTVYVNEAIPDLTRYLRTSATGEPIRFGGSSRDLFLYARDECLEELEDRLNELFADRAEVWQTQALLSAGLFGPPPFDRLLPRLGNLVVLPYSGASAFWREGERIGMRHKASHGGLTPEEMETELCLLPL
jgi:hypothetical protein